MINCEHEKLWKKTITFIKFDHKKISNKKCKRISEFENLFWQYQFLNVFTMLKFSLNEKKKDIINVEKFDMKKIRFYFFSFSQFRWLIIIWFQTIETIVMIFTYKTFVRNHENVHDKWNLSTNTSRHRNKNEEKTCSMKNKLWHICFCNFNNSFYNFCLMNESIFIVIFSTMIFDWQKNTNNFISYNENDDDCLIYLMTHDVYEKKFKKIFEYTTKLIERLISISTKLKSNEISNSDVFFIWNEKFKNFFLTSSLRNKYIQKRFQKKSCKYVIIIITLFYVEQCEIYFKSKQYSYYIDQKQRKTMIASNFSLVCFVLIFVNETHLIK